MCRKGLAVALTYCGAVVGAGFATGREVADFFTVYGRYGYIGVIVALGLFIWVGTAILDITHRENIYSYYGLLQLIFPWKPFILVADLVFCVSLLAGAGVMTAAASTIVINNGFSDLVAGLVFIILCICLLYRGSASLIKASTILVPLLVIGILALSIIEVSWPTFNITRPGPILSAVLYVAFNTAMAAVVLTTLKDQLDEKVARVGGLVGGALLGALLLVVYLATAGVVSAPMPMAALAEKWFGDLAWVYKLTLLAAVLTTALANIHGLASRLAPARHYKTFVIGTAFAGLIISRYGFTDLVRFVYPMLGYCNVVLLLGLCYYKFKRET